MLRGEHLSETDSAKNMQATHQLNFEQLELQIKDLKTELSNANRTAAEI